MSPNGIITLTTDFGQTDSYVGAMKGVILGIAPEARIVDVTHNVHPQDIYQAAYMLQTFYRYFPIGTVHLIVVDPGVGSTRRAIAVETPEAWFVAPDNGVLTDVWRDAVKRWSTEEYRAVELTDQRFWRAELSKTFHGRDIFAPVAAHLARGTPLEQFGPGLIALTEAELAGPMFEPDQGLVGRVVHIDHFGNCITNITSWHVQQGGLDQNLTVEINNHTVTGLMQTYADVPVGALLALIGSSDQLEIALRNGNAADLLRANVGDVVRVSR